MKNFIKNNEGFICEHCGATVETHPTSSRDHCTKCLWGKHVDVKPGDRKNKCKGLLKPMGIKIASGKTQIVYSCLKCRQQVFCVQAPDDNFESILEYSNKKYF